MSLRNKKKIAIFICDLPNEYQQKLVAGLMSRAAADGYYTVCYTFFSEYGENYEYEKGERNLVLLPRYDEYDGIFICFDTFSDSVVIAELYARIKAKAKCPVVSIRRECGDFNTILIQDDDSMRSVIYHLMDKHNIRDFFYVSGPQDHPDAIKRLQCMRKVLSENNIELNDEDIYFGDFWRNVGKKAVDAALTSRGGNLPKAFVCANDYMAISVCNELSARGYVVPNDTIVTGFDDIEEARHLLPSLTSVRVDVDMMAVKSWNMLLAMMKGQPVNRNEYVSTEVEPRQSCGCEEESRYEMGRIAKLHYDEILSRRQESFQLAFMSVDTGRELNIEALNGIIFKYIFNNIDYKDFFMVYNDYDWANIDENSMHGYSDKMHVRTAIMDNELLKNVDVEIALGDLLPDNMVAEEPCGYYVVPMHYLDRSYGYAIISYANQGTITDFMRYMIISISNALESIRSAQKINGLVNRLSKMYVTDAMTALKNRHGFEEDSVRLFGKAQREGRRLAIIGIDMDGLKSINDTYGHAEGDSAIKTLAKAIEHACFAEEQGYRVGGDEFQVLAMNYSEDNVKRFMDKLLSYLVEYNAVSNKPYNVRCSYGYAITAPGSGKNLNEWMTLSDNNMYAMKEKNRPTRKILRK